MKSLFEMSMFELQATLKIIHAESDKARQELFEKFSKENEKFRKEWYELLK